VLQRGLVLALLALPIPGPSPQKLIESRRFPQVALVGAGGVRTPGLPPPAQRRPLSTLTLCVLVSKTYSLYYHHYVEYSLFSARYLFLCANLLFSRVVAVLFF